MEHEPFETLARLYLDEEGYIVSTDVSIPQKWGGGDIDILALHPDRKGAIIGFCTTNTNGIPVRKWSRQIQKQKRFILGKYPSLNGDLEFWYFTLWIGKNEERKRAELERLGFQRIIGPREFRRFLYWFVRDYGQSWEKERKAGPREREPIRWTVKALCRLGLLKRRRHRKRR
jgi:hypothetical protein